MKNQNLQGLREANKECKTISGACKIIRAFWASGYKKAFEKFGLSFDDFKDVPSIIDLCQKDACGNIYITTKKAQKDEEGNYILTEDGKRLYLIVDKIVKAWTPNTLFNVLSQSQD
jgi:hypothetical protein